MTADEYSDVVEWIEDRWPGALTKAWLNDVALFSDFEPYDKDLMLAAVQSIYREGRATVPGPSVVMAKLREVAGATGVSVRGPCEHRTRAHERPSDLGSEYRLAGGRGPGRTYCVNPACYEQTQLPCACEELCRPDPLFATTKVPR